MIITPAKFEDRMREVKAVDDAFALMLETLESMGYGAGIDVFMNKFMYDSLLTTRNDSETVLTTNSTI